MTHAIVEHWFVGVILAGFNVTSLNKMQTPTPKGPMVL